MRSSVAGEPPSTPTTSRSFVGRTLRSHTRSRRVREKDEHNRKITGYFNIRKRLHPDNSKIENLKHRSEMITNAHAKTPTGAVLSNLSVANIQEQSEDLFPSPPKRPRLPTSLGVFDILGEFERFDFLASIPIEYFTKLVLTSHACANFISKYMESKAWKNRFIMLSNNQNAQEDPFTAVGELLKAITIANDTESRIAFMIKFVESVHDHLNGVDGWFNFFRTFTRCWAANEKARIVKAVKKMNGRRLEKLFKSVMTAEPGFKRQEEMELRRLLRGYFVHPHLRANIPSSEMHEAGFWFSCMLKGLHNNVVTHCRICLIIFTPTIEIDGKEEINYRTFVDDVVTSIEDVKSRLSPLATGLSALLSLKERPTNNSSWRYDEIFNLIEEITTFPSPWSFDNFVAFLLSRKNLLSIAVTTRINHSHRQEAGQIINTMKTLMFRWGMDTTEAIGGVFRQIVTNLTPQHREMFIRSVFDAHVAQYREYLCMGFVARANCDEEVASFMAFSPVFNEYLHYLRE